MLVFNFKKAALASAVASLLLVACGGGGGGGGSFLGSSIAIKGTAAAGSSLNGVVMIKDSTGRTANTNTDSSGNYQFTTTQLAGMTAPYMLEVIYKIGGVDYYLNSAATAQDLSNGPSTINITPLTDLVVANLAHDIATNVFNNGNFSSILTSAALSAGATALAAQLQPLLTAQGINGTVDLLHQSFTANSGTGLDALLDALQVTVDPATQTAIITNRLNNTSITNSLTGTNTTQISATNNVSLTDLQAITAGFNAFSAEMAKAPSATDPALLAFFDQANFQQDGQSLALFLQMITTNPTVVGGVMSFSNIVLDPVPTWVTTVPAGATAAYKAHFTVMRNNSPNSREEFIVYKSAGGAWLLLGNQKIAKAIMESLETFGFTGNSQTTAYCTGLNPQVAIKGGSAHISYAVITGPGLPTSGLLLFNPGANSGSTDFVIAAGDVSTYNGTNTPSMTTNTSSCGFNSLYPLNDITLTSTSAPIVAGSQYTFKLYDDNSTPTNPADDTLLATYKPMLFAAPLLNSQLNATLFPSIGSAYVNQLATVVTDANASTVQSFTAHWTAPTATGLYASNAWINIWSPTLWDNVSVDLPWNATSATVAIPLLSGTNHANATLEYNDAGFRKYWSNYGN